MSEVEGAHRGQTLSSVSHALTFNKITLSDKISAEIRWLSVKTFIVQPIPVFKFWAHGIQIYPIPLELFLLEDSNDICDEPIKCITEVGNIVSGQPSHPCVNRG